MSGHTSAGKLPGKSGCRFYRCRCTLLAGNSSISLAGSEEQMNFSQQSPKMLKNGFRKLYSCFVVVFRYFSQNFPLGAPGPYQYLKAYFISFHHFPIHYKLGKPLCYLSATSCSPFVHCLNYFPHTHKGFRHPFLQFHMKNSFMR